MPYDDLGAFSGRIRVSVPRMGISESAATNVALILHELATNSVKHGALSDDAGLLDVSCLIEDEDAVIIWTERGGPSVSKPDSGTGFGSGLLDRLVTRQLNGAIDYAWLPEGLIVTLRIRSAKLGRG